MLLPSCIFTYHLYSSHWDQLAQVFKSHKLFDAKAREGKGKTGDSSIVLYQCLQTYFHILVLSCDCIIKTCISLENLVCIIVKDYLLTKLVWVYSPTLIFSCNIMMILLLFGFGCHIFPAYVLKFQKVSFLLTLIIGFIFRRQLD